MIVAQPELKAPKELRLWPGVVAVAAQWLVRFVVPRVFPEAGLIGVFGELAGGLAVLVWWVFFSRAAWSERLGAVVLMVAGLFATKRLVDVSIATGAMGLLVAIYAIPVLSLALVVWAVATRRLSNPVRRASLVGTILLACGTFTVLRTGGLNGNGSSDFKWRWSKTPEEQLLSGKGDERVNRVPNQVKVNNTAEWPGFRGPDRDGVVRGVRIETDWSRSPPVRLWRRQVGPGWSSFAVRGEFLYTQEQRGGDELVTCYRLSTGEPAWRHSDPVRFWESNAGAGPRATPTVSNGRVYAFGATGILNALDADTGAVVWSRNVASDSNIKVPGWGFSSSPLVVDEEVIVAASGKLVGYDAATGQPRWLGPGGGGSYSSPHRVTLDGVAQIVLLNSAGATSVVPTNGAVLWKYAWEGVTIVQPALSGDGDLLISTGGGAGGLGLRRLGVTHQPGGWQVQERWTSAGLKPYFNDLVVHKGHAFGFDGSILACIELKEGARKWKGGRYGNGQLVLLAEQDLLLVLSEQGELALVAASPDEFRELARFPAIQGKTWNHPALIGDVLVVRNGEEMAAFRLSASRR